MFVSFQLSPEQRPRAFLTVAFTEVTGPRDCGGSKAQAPDPLSAVTPLSLHSPSGTALPPSQQHQSQNTKAPWS